jgi:hypothetical protein
MTDDLSRRAGQPMHEAFWPTDLFTQGIGWVITARFKSDEARVQASIFLVDVFCLGAKLALYEHLQPAARVQFSIGIPQGLPHE